MKQLQEYRTAGINYLLTRVRYFTEEVDNILDNTLRKVSNLPNRPIGDDFYNGILGHKPVVDQRKLCLQILFKRLSKYDKVTSHDYCIDDAVRKLNKLPIRPKKANPYSRLFKLPTIKKVDESKPQSDLTNFRINKEGLDLIKHFEGYYECVYKDPGSYDGKPYTGRVV